MYQRAQAASGRCKMAYAIDCEEVDVEAQPLDRQQSCVDVSVALQVSGFDRNGHFFTEQTATSDFSVSGCSFQLTAAVGPDALLALLPVGHTAESAARPVFYQVVWTKELPCGLAVGATRVPGVNAWRRLLFTQTQLRSR